MFINKCVFLCVSEKKRVHKYTYMNLTNIMIRGKDTVPLSSYVSSKITTTKLYYLGMHGLINYKRNNKMIIIKLSTMITSSKDITLFN